MYIYDTRILKFSITTEYNIHIYMYTYTYTYINCILITCLCGKYISNARHIFLVNHNIYFRF